MSNEKIVLLEGVTVTRYRNQFNRLINITLLRDYLGLTLKQGKDITDRIINDKQATINTDSMPLIQALGENGLDLHFVYSDGSQTYEAWIDENGMTRHPIQTTFSEAEIQQTLSGIPRPCLVNLDGKYLIMDETQSSALVIENDFLDQACIDYLKKIKQSIL